jgi:hypothetical protein
MFKNPFDSEGRWFKANLHTHTTTSDGEATVAERCRQYCDHGYQVLAITDHDQTNDLSGLSTGEFLVISGLETHPPCPDMGSYHLVCLDVPHGFSCSHEPDARERIRMVKAAGGEVIIGHPYWCGMNVNHLLPLNGAVAMEVYNATCQKSGKGYSSVHWDDLLDAGRILPAVAVDDVHYGRDIFMGWTMIKARELSVGAVMDALRAGCYYASCGPVIEDARIEDGKLKVKCSPAMEIHFLAQRACGETFYADGGELLTSAECPVNSGWKYVRIEVIDSQLRHAWTNPFMLGNG